MRLTKTYGYLKKDLDMIENAINQSVQADHPVLRDASTKLLEAGGKRIRPTFVLLAGQFGNYNIERMKTVAVALELIHMASLVHDDVIDDADLRRGKPTVKKMYDNRVAMYMGDYVLASALEHIATLKYPKAHQVLSKTMVQLVLGEIEQIKVKYNVNQNIRQYLRRIRRKTALLIATSCKLGALAADIPVSQAAKLYKYGYYIGMSYQIIDDILDFTASEAELGKPAGNDLMQGNITLPVLFAMTDKTFRSMLTNAFSDPKKLDSQCMKELIFLLKQTDAIKESYRVSECYLQKALLALNDLPNVRAKSSLEDIAKYIGKRRS